MYTLGQNGQDFLYGVVFIDGTQTYRLKGRMGDITLFLLQILNGLFGEKDVKAYGNYDWTDFKIEKDGTFEVILSPEKHEGNWIKVDPSIGYQFILIRRALPNWEGDPGDLSLERISELPDDHYDADEFDEAAMATRIRRAALFLRYLTHDFNINLYDWYSKNSNTKKNTLTLLPGTVTSQVGSPTSSYAMAVFELKDDEALLIEMDRKPDGAYWSFQLGDVWSRSLDFTSRQSSLNDHEALPDGDGKLRLVVSQRDPGIANWLDPCGRVKGTWCSATNGRRRRCAEFGRGETRRAGHVLAKDTRRVSSNERREMNDRGRRE